MTSRRGFLGAIAAALVLDPERALWVPGRKLISIPAPRVVRPLFEVGDVVTFGNDPQQRFVCMKAGDPSGLGATFAFLSGPGLPWRVLMPKLPALDPRLFRPPAIDIEWAPSTAAVARAAARREAE